MKKLIPFIIFLLFISGLVFGACKYENPIQETWARNYIEENIAEGWGINMINRAYTPNTPYYEVRVELYELKTFHSGEAYHIYNLLYFDKNGTLVRSDLNDNWKK